MIKQFYSNRTLCDIINTVEPRYKECIEKYQNDLAKYERHDNTVHAYVRGIIEPELLKPLDEPEPKKSFWSRLFSRKQSESRRRVKHYLSIREQDLQKRINLGLPKLGYDLIVEKYLCEPYDKIINETNLLYKQHVYYKYNSVVVTVRKVYPHADDYNVNYLKRNLTVLNDKMKFLQRIRDNIIGAFGLIFDEKDVEWLKTIEAEYEELI